MREELLLLLVDYAFDVPCGKVKFLGKPFKCHAVQKPALEDVPVSLGKDPLVDEMLPF
jgi:hypothetical protein